MRRCLLIAAFLLLTAPAAALADGVVTTKLSSTPDSLTTGKPWKVTLTIRQQGRAPRSDLRPSIQIVDADGFSRTFPATRGQARRALPRDGHVPEGRPVHATRSTTGSATRRRPAISVVIKDPAPVVDRPDPVGPRGLPIALAGLLALAARRLRARAAPPPARHGPLHPA